MPEGRVVHHYINTYGPSKTVTKIVGRVVHVYHYRHITRPPSQGQKDTGSGGGGGDTGGNGGNGSGGVPQVDLAAQRRREQQARTRALQAQARARQREARKQMRLYLAEHRVQQLRGRFPTGRPTPDEPGFAGARLAVRNVRLARAQVRKRREGERDNLGRGMMRLSSLIGQEDRTRRLGIDGPRNVVEHVNFHDFTRLLLDPEVGGFDPESSAHVELVQRWLKAHADSTLPVDGVFGPRTYQALLAEGRKQFRRQQRERLREVRRRYFDPGILTVGEKLDGLPLFGGVAPTPKKILQALEAGGFSASVLLNFLERQRAEFGDLEFDLSYSKWRGAFLRDAERTLTGPFVLPGFLAGGPKHFVNRVAGTAEILSARSFDDLQRRLIRAEYLEDYDRRQEMLETSEGWFWRHTYLDEMFDYTLAGLDKIALGEEAIDLIVTDYYYFGAMLNGEGLNRYEAERRADASISAYKEQHPWLYLLAEIVLDPTSYIPGKWVAMPFTVGAKVIRASERLGVTLTATGKIGTLPLILAAPAGAGRFAGKGLGELERATLGQFRRAAAIPLAQRGVIEAGLARSYQLAVRATRLKLEAKAHVKNRAAALARHNFLPANAAKAVDKIGRDGVTFDWKLRQLLDNSDDEVVRRAHEPAPALFDALLVSKASLYATDVGHELSQVGTMIAGAVKESARVNAARSVARDEATAYARRAIDGKYVKGSKAEKRAFADAYKQGYDVATDRIGVFFAGGNDKELGAAVRALAERAQQDVVEVWLPALQRRLVMAAEADGRTLFHADTGIWHGAGSGLETQLRNTAYHAIVDDLEEIPNPLFKRYFSAKERDEYVHDEVGRRVARIEGRAEVRRASGQAIDEKTIERDVREVFLDVEKAWEHTPAGWTDVRARIDVPRIYAKHRDLLGTINADKLYAAMLRSPDSVHPLSGLLLEPVSREGLFEAGRAPDWVEEANAVISAERKSAARRRALNEPIFDVGDELGTVASWLDGSFPRGYDVLWGDAPPGIVPDVHVRLGIESLPPTGDFAFHYSAENIGELERYARFKKALELRRAALTDATPIALQQLYKQEGLVFEAIRHAEGSPLRRLYNGWSGLSAFWVFATLPLRAGWVARNVADNAVKVFLAGARDPRIFFLGGRTPGSGVRALFGGDVRLLRQTVALVDRKLGQNGAALEAFDGALEQVWQLNDDVLQRLFGTWAGIHVPTTLIQQARLSRDLEDGVSRFAQSFRDGVWELMADKPESYFKRVLYRATYAKEIGRGADEVAASLTAWKSVEATLFDYSKISVLEENVKIIWPFVQFWRKNTGFWLRQTYKNPWFFIQLERFDEGRKDIHSDWPEWMRRYVHIHEVTDAVASVPGLGWLAPHLAQLGDVMYDPYNYLSVAPMYRAFKDENPELPADKQGWAFIAPFVDAINEWGLSLNPFLRKPLEMAGILNYRAWQKIFPQSDLLRSFTAEYFHERFGETGLDIEAWLTDPIFQAIGSKTGAEANEERFNQYVQMEIAGQVARGEEANRAVAEDKIRDYFWVQSVVGYFAGAYVRRMTPSDFHLYTIAQGLRDQELDFRGLSAADQQAYRLFARRKLDPLEYDRYLDVAPLIQAYYEMPNYAAKERYKADNPTILPFVEPVFQNRAPTGGFVRDQMLVSRTDAAMDFYDLVEKLDLDPKTAKAAERFWVTPELRAFWDRDNTGREDRERMIRAEYHRYLVRVQDTFFALPEEDWDAKAGYLREHPELQRWWNKIRNPADDFEAVANSANATLRERYFEIVEEEGFDAAGPYLKQFPFMFDGTTAENRIVNGEWTGKGDGSLNHGLSQHARDYLAAKGALDTYFALSKGARSAWLNGGSASAQTVLAYFKKYGKVHSAGRRFAGADWARYASSRNPELRRRVLFWKRYFELRPDQRIAYIRKHAAGAGVFVYGPLGAGDRAAREAAWLRQAVAMGMTEKAARYLRIKPLLDLFFTLSKEEKRLLMAANPELAAYFDDYASRSITGDGELDKLIEAYFKLPPDSESRTRFLENHPQVQDYFDSKSSPAERAMRNLLEVYFDLAYDERKEFLFKHPEIQAYFDERARERSRRRQLMVAFEQSDPRLAIFNTDSELIAARAERMRYLLRVQAAASRSKDALEIRRERKPA